MRELTNYERLYVGNVVSNVDYWLYLGKIDNEHFSVITKDLLFSKSIIMKGKRMSGLEREELTTRTKAMSLEEQYTVASAIPMAILEQVLNERANHESKDIKFRA